MKELYVIESVIHLGSFWADEYDEFKGWLFASKYFYEGLDSKDAIRKASLVEPCTLIKVYDK